MRRVRDATTIEQRLQPLQQAFLRLPLLGRLLQAPIIAQFVKFGLVGVSNTIITFVVFTVLTKGFGVWYVAASGIGFAVGALNGFLLNRSWTFQDHRGGSLAPLRWTIVQGCGLGADLGIIYLCVHSAGLPELLGQAVAIVLVTCSTFFVNRTWTFRMHLPAKSSFSDGL